ncbi:PREDICTED: odorant receptor 85b-like [Papilio xuthus]|uniref:Odorant receptor n=1 Tax=Papilio xuthus TaxID=66420 RepID=A0AAJ7E6T2_PAPXU|nr:PREDICTED: odorant receptor 85b-like [Papilio xuthus]
MSFLREYFFKKSNVETFSENQELKFDKKEYDASYDLSKTMFRLVGLRLTHNDPPLARLLWNAFYLFEAINVLLAMFLELIKMKQTARDGSFIELFTMMPCVGYLLLCSVKSYKILYYRPVYENLITELRDMWPQDAVTKEEYDIVRLALVRLRRNIKGFLALGFMLPTDALFWVFLSHITTQFDLLAIRLKKMFYVPLDEQLIEKYPLGNMLLFLQCDTDNIEFNNNNESEKVYQKKLVDVILKHRALIRMSGVVENQFTFSLLINFINSSIIICFCGFCCMFVEKWNEITYKFFLTTATLQIWLVCWYGQKLLDSSQGIADAVYCSGWYNVPQRVKSFLIIIFYRAQKEVYVTTYGFSVISIASYSTILKTSWSYLMLLVNVFKK